MFRTYNPRMPRPLSKPRPEQGARLLALRKAAGLSQTELAELIGESQRNIAYWETSEHPPRSDALPALARVLGVSVEDLLRPDAPLPRKRGPVSRLQKLIDELAQLPKRQQDRIVDVLEALVKQHRRDEA